MGSVGACEMLKGGGRHTVDKVEVEDVMVLEGGHGIKWVLHVAQAREAVFEGTR